MLDGLPVAALPALILTLFFVQAGVSAVSPVLALFVSSLIPAEGSKVASLAGLILGATAVTSAFAAGFAGKLGDRFGHEKTIATGWAGSGSFRDLLTKGLPEDIRITGEPPYLAYDVRRHGDPRPAPIQAREVSLEAGRATGLPPLPAMPASAAPQSPAAPTAAPKAEMLQPAAPAVRSLEVVLLARTGRQTEALQLARAAMRDPAADVDVLNAASLLAWRSGDFDLAAQAMELKAHKHPRHRAVAYLELGNIHAKGTRDAAKAEAAYRAALASASPGQRGQLLRQIPPEFRGRLAGLADSLPPPADQTSSSRP